MPYALGIQKPIRIIVKNGHLELNGVVNSDADKNAAGLRANTVPGIFSVTNNLRVVASLLSGSKIMKIDSDPKA
jgi:hyperosmotically inducible periplasmic protein